MGEMVIFDYMNKNDVCSHVEVNTRTKEIKCEDYTNILHRTVFGKRPHTMENLHYFFKSRCFSEQRPDKNAILELMGLTQYNPYDIVRKTFGMTTQDHSWIRWQGETRTWEEVLNREKFDD